MSSYLRQMASAWISAMYFESAYGSSAFVGEVSSMGKEAKVGEREYSRPRGARSGTMNVSVKGEESAKG
jgi:hypothetical protein